jgi:uncharacterized membrane protein YedE/YeeE
MATQLDSASKRLLGLGTGLAFGALLQHGRLARYDVILGQLALRDGSVIKAMGTAVMVGAVGLQLLDGKGITKTGVKPMKVGGIVAGSVLFGAGLATLGYCPGTSVAAVGEGRRDALAGVAGMLVGAAAFVALYRKLVPIIEAGGDYGKITLPAVTNTKRSRWVAPMAIGALAAAATNEVAQRRRSR